VRYSHIIREGIIMDDFILHQQTTWRYCRVRDGEKRPYPANWQNTPLELWAVDSGNVGLLLGPVSEGTCAIDFDGHSAYTWAESQGIDLTNLPTTPMWSSGKPGRCQMAFGVPNQYWLLLNTLKVPTWWDIETRRAIEGIEFRWTGCQSVVPPSRHPDTGRPYEWLIDAMNPMAGIPDDILSVWLNYRPVIAPNNSTATANEPDWQQLQDTEIEDINQLLTALKSHYPVLEHDVWRDVAWAVARGVGRSAGEILMKEYYPEQRHGEYANQLYRNYNIVRSPGPGRIVMLIRERDPDFRKTCFTETDFNIKLLNKYEKKYKI
jgi:hypothetical protein